MRKRNEPPKLPLPRCFRPRRERCDLAPAVRAHRDYVLARVNIELRIDVASLDETLRVVHASPNIEALSAEGEISSCAAPYAWKLRSRQTRARRSDQLLRGAYA